MPANKQQEGAVPTSGIVANDADPDEIQVLSSEVIVVEGGVEDGVKTERSLAPSKLWQTMTMIANPVIKTLFSRNVDITS